MFALYKKPSIKFNDGFYFMLILSINAMLQIIFTTN
jgi:hypothetical protein